MAETVSRLPIKVEKATAPWRPFASLRREIDRLFEDFDQDLWGTRLRRSMFEGEPMWREEMMWGAAPAVDITEGERAFELTAELPGMDEKSIEIKLANGGLTIKGEKAQEKEEKKRNYYLHERHFGAFERFFRLPEGIDVDRIEATFKKGLLTVTLPKTVEAQKAEKKIEVKTAA
jgi:HSP20 family protein